MTAALIAATSAAFVAANSARSNSPISSFEPGSVLMIKLMVVSALLGIVIGVWMNLRHGFLQAIVVAAVLAGITGPTTVALIWLLGRGVIFLFTA